MLALALTFTVLFSIMFFVVGALIGWLVNQFFYERGVQYNVHPEMFDSDGNIIPDDILAVRFENPEDLEEE
jgi:uncharacterized membrane protein SpoIIM required for sporulation